MQYVYVALLCLASLLLLAYAVEVTPCTSSTCVQRLKRRRASRRLYRRKDNDSSDDDHSSSDDENDTEHSVKQNSLMPNCYDDDGNLKKACEKLAKFLKGGIALVSMGSKSGSKSKGD
ncbi:hypothetical protein H4R34_003496 [Dimargaris verticillata]|uniref:Uncharacterized protein n=1 Tax=Dimargaris verticillata TaxID=2761393 RepID=A0A9W8EBZ1_9FUNG|nr:hypothetical protein H4R34_003496 [Dimargaris verticillata]